jgi:hypothetical protein
MLTRTNQLLLTLTLFVVLIAACKAVIEPRALATVSDHVKT